MYKQPYLYHLQLMTIHNHIQTSNLSLISLIQIHTLVPIWTPHHWNTHTHTHTHTRARAHAGIHTNTFQYPLNLNPTQSPSGLWSDKTSHTSRCSLHQWRAGIHTFEESTRNHPHLWGIHPQLSIRLKESTHNYPHLWGIHSQSSTPLRNPPTIIHTFEGIHPQLSIRLKESTHNYPYVWRNPLTIIHTFQEIHSQSSMNNY